MPSDREQRPGSFRDGMDELLSRLSHEGVIGAGMQAAPRPKLPRNWSRSPAFHNRALFDWRHD